MDEENTGAQVYEPMPNQMYGQMQSQAMQSQMWNQQMVSGQMVNPMNGQMYGQMPPNQMPPQMAGGQMYDPLMNQMGNPQIGQTYGQMQNPQMGYPPPNPAMNQMYGQPQNSAMPNQMWNQQAMNGQMPVQAMNYQVVSSQPVDVAPSAFNEQEVLAKMEREMVNSEEVRNLAQGIDINNYDTILMFGREAMEEMSRVSDAVVQDQTRAMLLESNSTKLLDIFSKLFSQIDPSELHESNGILGKIFGDLKKKVEKFIAKYQKISVDIDRIYAELKQYEEDTRQGNRKLAMMYDANLNTFHALKLYIFAAQQASIDLGKEIQRQRQLFAQTGNNEITLQIGKLEQAQHYMEKQADKLLKAQSVALQSLPQINMQQLTNYNIISKVNEYFLVGLPIMKQGIAQAIMLKRQKIMTESLSELDKKMNEMLVRNAENTVEVAKNSMALSEQSTISAETLETTWKTIVNGIDEVRKIQKEGSKKRIEDEKKLEAIKEDFYKRLGEPVKAN